MLKRTITGFFILLFTAGFIALRQVSPLFFDAFMLVIMYASVVEVALASKFSDRKIAKVLVFLYPAIVAVIYIFSTSVLMSILLQMSAALLMFALLMTSELIENAIIRKHGDTVNEPSELNSSLLNQTKFSMQIVLYPTTLLGFMMGINHFGLNLGYIAIIMVFAISMMTDVFAYLFGSLIRGPKMAPEISPKKSISGMIFGAVGGMLAAGLGYLFFVHLGWFGNAFAGISSAKVITTFVLMGVVGTFLTQFGDLVASAYKRKVGIKDFGNIFPGHGGFMDRVDGLMFTATLVYILFALFII